MDKEEARQYLASLLNKTLRIHATDGRMFLGAFRCTDADQNVVIANTYEYRQPSEAKVKAAAEAAPGTSAKLDMTSRYLGLVILPGQHIVKIEVEHFASQMKSDASWRSKLGESSIS